MPSQVAISKLNASTFDILNTIRMNASPEYQNLIPTVDKYTDIPKVGEVLYGYPALANQFLSSLMNRIAMVRVKSATFNNAYKDLKKGYLEFGETVEEVFVELAKAREFNPDKGEEREFKRSIPDVRTAFHVMNYRAQYPITVSMDELRTAFLSMNGVQDLISRIVDSVYTSAEYDEYLLFKYLIIKGINKGAFAIKSIGDGTMLNAGKQFRGVSNDLTFIKTKYNASGVHTSTKKEDQNIFMDSFYNADYDVNVLASAFNMDKATYSGKLRLIDSFEEFDNDRFSVIADNSTMIEPVTPAELLVMKDVKAVLVDTEWFQIYDNNNTMTEKFVASGSYWNYFYNVWKTVSYSPFSNAVAFVTESAMPEYPASIAGKVASVDVSDVATIVTVELDSVTPLLGSYNFVQGQIATTNGIAVHKFGTIIFPKGNVTTLALQIESADGVAEYETSSLIGADVPVGTDLTFTKQ